jgi:trehalose-6-phosphate synthase
MVGYSNKPLKEKLGIKSGQEVAFIHFPDSFPKSLGALPDNFSIGELHTGTTFDFIIFFTTSKEELQTEYPSLKEHLKQDGMLWISWPKKSSKMETDLNENIIRDLGLTIGLVDIKVCAIDEYWSGLKFVIRKENRK